MPPAWGGKHAHLCKPCRWEQRLRSPSLRGHVSVGAREVRSGGEGLYGRPRSPFKDVDTTTNTWSCIELVFSGAQEPPGRDLYPPRCSPRHVANARCSPHVERSGKKGRLMIKRYIRWILPLVVIVLIGVYFLVSPMVATHAAGSAAPAAPSQITTPHGQTPDMFWRP